MRVLVVHGRYRSAAPSGENHVVDQEVSALRAAGHEVEVFERRSDEIADWSLARKAAVPARSVWNGEVRRDLVRRLAWTRPEVVHVHNTFPLLSASVLRACADSGVPVVATLHNYKLLCASGDFFRAGQPCHDCSGDLGAPGLRHGCYRGSRLATVPVVTANAVHRGAWRTLVAAYVFISAAQRDLMSGLGLPSERVFVKHNFVPPPSPVGRHPERVVAYLGRLDAAKGLPLLMRSWDVFREVRPDATLRLVVAGGGPMEDEVRSWATRHPTVDVVGLLSRSEAAELLGRALVAVVPSEWEETFGLVAVEAMAAGVAPVVPASGSFPELVTDGHDGVHVPPRDPYGLAMAFAAVDADPDHHIGLGRRGRVTYETCFAREGNVAALLDIYRFAIANPIGVR